ncbi:hypothetical protein I0E98_10150 [Pseudomonas lalucatii]|nr:hypothetical protein [Pseudomonas lalucatii]
MKKITLLLAGLMASGMASAVELTGTGGVVQRIGDCETLLNEDVRVNLTSGVEAGVNCSATRIAIATCHTAGRQVGRSAEVVTACDVEADPECEDTVEVQTVTGPAMAYATTTRGTVISGYPGGACSATTADIYATGR